MSEIVVEVAVQAPPVVEVVVGGGSGGGGGVSPATVQAMIEAEVGPATPNPALIFDQYLI